MVLHAAGEHDLTDDAEIAARIGRVAVDGLVEAAHVQAVPAGAEEHGVARETRDRRGVERRVRAERPETVVESGRTSTVLCDVRRRRARGCAKLRSARAVHSTR